MNWYVFNQNNSGGRFHVTDTVCHRLFIEAPNYDKAIEKAEELGCYWNGVAKGRDCSCCGDRWNCYNDEPINLSKYNGDIKSYAQWLSDGYGWTSPDGRIFYADGNVEEVYSKKRGLFLILLIMPP